MIRNSVAAAWAFVAVVLAGGQVFAEGILLAEGGRTDYRIVIPADVDAGTRAVADDFAGILKEMTGATFPVVTDSTPSGEKEIVVGERNARVEGFGLGDMTRDFAEGEYEIRTVGETIVIAGAPRRGTINGMYGFLQDQLGCRWFTPGCQYVPKKATVKLGEIRDRQKPAFRWRSTDSNEQWDANWVIRNRLNESKAGVSGGYPAVMQVHGDPRSIGMTNCWRPHAFADIPVSLFDEHPEYYSELGGKRICDANANARAYCVTNEGFAKWVAEWTKEKLRSKQASGMSFPEMDFVSITHADNGNFCRCEVCQASYEEVGIGGTYIRFGNRVAAEVVKEFPDARIITFAYGITFPPNPVEAHPNLRVCWCPISADYAHALDEGGVNRDRDFVGQLAKWQAKSTQLGIWYYQWQADKLMPRLMLHPTKRNLQIFRDRGVDQVFIEMNLGSFKTKKVSDGDKFLPAYANAEEYGWFIIPFGLEHVRSYAYARLLWDPDFDVAEGIREFCDVYYGDAGAEMMTEYVNALESLDSYDKTMGGAFKAHDGIYMGLSLAPRLKWTVAQKLDKLFDVAEEEVKGEATILRRVQMARLSVDLSILVYARPDDPLRKQAFERFFARAEEIGLKGIQRTVVSPSRMTLAEFKELMSHPEKLAIPGEEPVGANILKNSDFEMDIDADGIPDGWSAEGKYMPENYYCDPAGVTIVSTKARSGKYCVKFVKKPEAMKAVALRQRFDVKPGEGWRASVQYQADVKTGGFYMIFTAFDKDGNWLYHQGGAQGVGSTGDKWVELTSDNHVDDKTRQLMVEVLLYDDKAEGTVWIDDFEVAKIKK